MSKTLIEGLRVRLRGENLPLVTANIVLKKGETPLGYIRKSDMRPDVNTSNLHSGMIVKNYRRLCELVGEEIKGGSAKIAQLNYWSKYFKFYKQQYKNSYVIEEIYDIPLDIKENRGRSSKYLDKARTLLLYYLSINGGSLSYSRRIWYCLLGLVNNEYVKYNIQYGEKQDDKMPVIIANTIYDKSFSIYTSLINSLLEDKLITIKQEIICDNHYTGTEEMTDFVNKLEEYILSNVFEYKSFNTLYFTFQSHKFYDIMNKALGQKYGYKDYYKSYRFTLTDKGRNAVPPNANADIRNAINEKVIEYYNKKLNDEEKQYIDIYIKI